MPDDRIIKLPLTAREQNALMHVIAAATAAHQGQKTDLFEGDVNIAAYLVERAMRLRTEAPGTIANKSLRAFNIVMAFQKFAGKSLKATDHIEQWPDETIVAIENALRSTMQTLRTEDPEKWPDLQKLADQIAHNIGTEG